jgi:hypothetical protein
VNLVGFISSFLSSVVAFTGVGKATVHKAPRRGRNVRGGASRLPDRPVPKTAEKTEPDNKGG